MTLARQDQAAVTCDLDLGTDRFTLSGGNRPAPQTYKRTARPIAEILAPMTRQPSHLPVGEVPPIPT